MGEKIFQLVLVALGVPILLVGYLAVMERGLGWLPVRWQTRLRPWFWAGPALTFLAVFLLYPMFNTLYLSVLNSTACLLSP